MLKRKRLATLWLDVEMSTFSKLCPLQLENTVRNVIGTRKLVITASKLLIEELHNLYSSPSIIRMIKSRRIKWTGHVARITAKRNGYMILVGKPEGKKPLGRPRNRKVGNIEIDLREIG
jgi:hypothetical protein